MHPEFKLISQPFSNTLNIGRIEYLYFSGTAYLGIPQNGDFLELYIKGIKKFGLNNGTSRTNNIQLGIYDEAEKAAAERFKSEDALITSSGYLATQLTVKALSGFGKVLYAPATHPALWLENQSLNLKSFPEWAVETTGLINNSAEQNWVLVSNSMNNLFPEIYDFSFLEHVNPDKKISLIVDDSHGIGVNNNGLGAFNNLPKRKNIECVVVASMAKALGVDAGLVLGSQEIIGKLKSTHIFVGASPPAAAGLYAFVNAEKIYNKTWNKLQENIQLFSNNLKLPCKFEQGFPVFQVKDLNLADRLSENKILISSFPYPDVNGEVINRIILSSWHTEKDISRLISAIG